jgi:hypothetical protein
MDLFGMDQSGERHRRELMAEAAEARLARSGRRAGGGATRTRRARPGLRLIRRPALPAVGMVAGPSSAPVRSLPAPC